MECTIIKNIGLSFISSFALKCAVELDISGRIQAYGRPMPLNELARSIPIPPGRDSMLHSIMALLVHQGLFTKSEAGYQVTPVSHELLPSEGSNMGAFVSCFTEPEFLKLWSSLSHVLTDTDTSTTLFQKAFDGKHFWEVVKEPEFGILFDGAMEGQSAALMRAFVVAYPHIFDGLHSLVDVGGGTGFTAKIIAEAFPGLKCTVFDLPHVVAKALKSNSFNVVGGDMFEKIPPADAIFMKNILHDWTDKDCIRILKRCREAISDGGKVVLVEIILDLESDDPKVTETSLIFDMKMKCYFEAKERSKQEWHDIILGAGYSGYKICPTRLGIDSVIELYP